ncbi:MAG TPA: hypothetical protein VNR36_11555 [Pseudolysinimonas sp.]|nr:hypothetical protein [Pseudolysinimonas sp.]
MRAVVKGWLGFAALGAGLIHLALVIGSPPVIGMPLLLIGLAEFAWGVFAFAAAELPVPRAARIAAVVPLLFWVLMLLIGVSGGFPGVRVLPMLVASLLDLAIAVGVTALLRRAATEPRPLKPGRYLLALGAGALVVAALTTPALAATEAVGTVPPGTDLDQPGHGH